MIFRMSKEKLIELKKKLESEYVSYDGSDTSDVITLYEIEQSENEKGAVNNLVDYFDALIYKLDASRNNYDKLEISAVYKLFYKKENIDEMVNNNPTTNTVPLKDFVIISFGCYRATDGLREYNSDPEDIYDGCYNEFIVSFEKFKKFLNQRGFGIGTISSFDEIENMIKNGLIPITFYELEFNKSKRLIKE